VFKNITKEFRKYLENKNTKVAQRALKKLDENIAVAYESDICIWIEPHTSHDRIPEYLYKQFLQFVKHYQKSSKK